MAYSKKGELRQEMTCAEVFAVKNDTSKMIVRMYGCHGWRGSQEWILTNVSKCIINILLLLFCIILF